MAGKKKIKILDTEARSARENMELDRALLEGLKTRDEAILHLYDWERPSLTYGYFIRPEQFLDLKKLKEKGIDIARRPTGGGIVFHIWDLAFSFIMPYDESTATSLGSYRFVNQIVLEAFSEFSSAKGGDLTPEDFPPQGKGEEHFCMAKPTKYDVIFRGKKVAGAAQRRKESGFLHQGTISLCAPDLTLLREILLTKERILEAMQNYSFTLYGDKKLSREEFFTTKERVKKILTDKFMEKFASFDLS